MKDQPKQNKVEKLQLLRNWLLSGRTITARQCSKMWGYDRLSDGIWKLRREGMRIESPLHSGKDRFLNDVHYAVYKWLGEIPKINFRSNHGKVKTYDFWHKYPMTLAQVKSHIRNYVKKFKAKVKGVYVLKNKGVMADTNTGKKIFIIHHVQRKLKL